MTDEELTKKAYKEVEEALDRKFEEFRAWMSSEFMPKSMVINRLMVMTLAIFIVGVVAAYAAGLRIMEVLRLLPNIGG